MCGLNQHLLCLQSTVHSHSLGSVVDANTAQEELFPDRAVSKHIPAHTTSLEYIHMYLYALHSHTIHNIALVEVEECNVRVMTVKPLPCQNYIGCNA